MPTAKGVALGLGNCSLCHTRAMPDGTLLRSAPWNEIQSRNWTIQNAAGDARRSSSPATCRLGRLLAIIGRSLDQGDITKRSRRHAPGSLARSLAPSRARLFPRWNGSASYPTKIPDIIGIKDRKYIDHTATHQHRGPGDLMRYAALVTYSDSSDFGPHRMLTDEQRRVSFRAPDEAFYALRCSLLAGATGEPEQDIRIADGQGVFDVNDASVATRPRSTRTTG